MPPSSPNRIAPRIALPDAPSLVAGHGRAAILTTDGELLACPADEAAAAIRAMDAADAGARAGDAAAAGAARRCRPAICWSCSRSCCRRAPPRRRRAGWRWRWTWTSPGRARDAGGLEAEVALLPELVERLLRRLAAGRDLALNRDAAGAGGAHGPRRLGLGAVRAGRTRTAGCGGLGGAAAGLEAAAGVGGNRAAAARPRRCRWPRPRRGGGWRRCWGRTPSSGRARRIMPAPRQRRSRRARCAAIRTWCWPRPAPARARRWATSPRPACGRRRTSGTVWISTFTRHLQRQIDAELARLFPDPVERRRRVVVRKGRENYLCLLNYEEALRPMIGGPGAAAGGRWRPRRSPPLVPLGLIARWALATADGDIQGGDLPGWFAELFGDGDGAEPGGPARGVHPRRLPALEALLRRAHDPPGADRASGGGEPCAGDGAGGLGRAGRCLGADALRVRRGPPRVRRRGRRVLGRAVRGGDGGAAALAAGRRGRAVARTRACGGGWTSWWPSGRTLETPLDAALAGGAGAARRRAGGRGWGSRTTRNWTPCWRSCWGRMRRTPSGRTRPRRSCACCAARCWRGWRATASRGFVRRGAPWSATCSRPCAGLAEAADRSGAGPGADHRAAGDAADAAGARGWRTRRRTWTPPRGSASRRRAARSGGGRSTR